MEKIIKQRFNDLSVFHVRSVVACLAVSLLALIGCNLGESNIPEGADIELSLIDGGAGSRIKHADEEPHNWLSHGRNYEETRYSPLDQISTKNVDQLGLQWSYDLDTENGQQASH